MRQSGNEMLEDTEKRKLHYKICINFFTLKSQQLYSQIKQILIQVSHKRSSIDNISIEVEPLLQS